MSIKLKLLTDEEINKIKLNTINRDHYCDPKTGECFDPAEETYIKEGARAQAKKILDWGNEPCSHRDNDFPCPDYVPPELQFPKRECRDCWDELRRLSE